MPNRSLQTRCTFRSMLQCSAPVLLRCAKRKVWTLISAHSHKTSSLRLAIRSLRLRRLPLPPISNASTVLDFSCWLAGPDANGSLATIITSIPPSHRPNITSFFALSCPGFDDDALRMLDALPNIQEIKLGAAVISDSGIRSFRNSHSQLRSVVLADCNSISDESIRYVPCSLATNV